MATQIIQKKVKDLETVATVNSNDYVLVETSEGTRKATKEVLLSGLSNDSNNNKEVDLIIFMGQSNMAGRGTSSQAPLVKEGQGFEFKAISDPTRLYPLKEPFGVNENKSGGINEAGAKTGSMVSAFVNSYYKFTKTPVVGVSASKGGSAVSEWLPNTAYLNDAISRYNTAKTWLLSNGYTIKNQLMVWCQGCTDGDRGTTKDVYKDRLKQVINEMNKQGVSQCLLVRIGNHRDNPSLYDNIILAQTELCKEYELATLVSTKLCTMAEEGLMKDQFHYTQQGYNIAGEDAGKNSAFYVNNGIAPYMYDGEYKNIYFPMAGSVVSGEPETPIKSEDVLFSFNEEGENGSTTLRGNYSYQDGLLTSTDANKGIIQLKKPLTLSYLEDFTVEFKAKFTPNTQLANSGDESGMILGNTQAVSNFVYLVQGLKVIRVRKFPGTQVDLSLKTDFDFKDALHHYALVHTKADNKIKLYVDNELVSESNYFTADLNVDAILGSSPNNQYSFVGTIDFIRVTHKALDVAQFHTE